MSVFPEHVRGHWFVAAQSAQVDRKPLRVVLLGAPVVLFRDSAENVVALEDRCPHRGMPLSEGRLSSDGIRCRYHGWSFRTDGRCRGMPGGPDDRPLADVRVVSFAVVEQDGLIWVNPTPEVPLPPPIQELNSANRRFLWQAKWKCSVVDAQENFLDALHTHTIRAGLVRRRQRRRPVKAILRVTADGFDIDYQGQAEQSGLIFRLFESRRTRERAHFSSLSVVQLEYHYAAGWRAWITLCFTPETECTTHIFAMLHVTGRWAPGWMVRTVVWPFIRRVAEQDRRVLEQQETARQAFPERRYVITALDLARPYLEAAWAASVDGLPAEREVVMNL